jgi:hypothetical protein
MFNHHEKQGQDQILQSGSMRCIAMTLPVNASAPQTPEEERKAREKALDETLEDSFPASDPMSSDPNPDSSDRNEDDRDPAKAS